MKIRLARLPRLCTLITAGLLASPLDTLLAVDFTWTNTAGGNWTTSSNWLGSNAPVSGNNTIIRVTNRAATYGVTYDPVTAQNFSGNNTSVAGQNAFTLGNSTGSGVVSFNMAQGSLTLNGTATGFEDNQLRINSGGRFNLSGNGTLNSVGMVVSGDGQYNQSGGTATVGYGNATSGSIQLRLQGSSQNTLSGGSLTVQNVAAFSVGASSGDNTQFLINGGTLVTTTNAALNISDRGTGTLRITSGAMNTAGLIRVGSFGNPTSTSYDALMDVQGGTINASGLLIVGANIRSGNATALLTMSGGVFNQSGLVRLGEFNLGTMALSGGNYSFSGTSFQIGGSPAGTIVDSVSTPANGVGVLNISGGNFTATNAAGNATVLVGRSQNDGLTTGNNMTVSGGAVRANVINVYRGGTLAISNGSTTVNRTLLISGSSGGGGNATVSGGTLQVTNAAGNGSLTIGQNGTFRVTGGQVTTDRFTGNATGSSLLVQGGNMTVTANSTSTTPVTVGGGVAPATLSFVGSNATYNTTAFYTFGGGASGGITVANNGVLSSQGKLSISSAVVIQSGGLVNLNTVASTPYSFLNDAPLVVSSTNGSVDVQSGGTLSTRSALFDNGARLNINGGAVNITRLLGDGQNELRFVGVGSGFSMTSGTLSINGTSSMASLLRLGANAAGATTGTLSGGVMNVSRFLLGDRGGIALDSTGADATFTMSNGTLNLSSFSNGDGLYIGGNPQSATTPYSRGFFNQSGGVVTNNGVLEIATNTQAVGVTYGTLAISGGTFNQNAITQVGVSGNGTGVLAAMNVSGGLFNSTANFSVGSSNATYTVGGAVTVSGSGQLTVSNGAGNATLNVSRTANDVTANNNSLQVTGGTLTADNLNIYRSGTLDMSAGTTQVNRTFLVSGASGGGGVTTLSGGNFSVASGNNTATFTVGQNASFLQTGGNATVDNATITANGASFAVQSGTFTASNALTASQAVTVGGGVSPGQIILANTGNFTNLTLSGNGSLNVNGATASVQVLSGSGAIGRSATGNGTLTVGSSTNTSFSGAISNASGVLSLTKVGNGTLTLSANNTYTGTTTVSMGTLIVNGGQSSSPVTVQSGAVLSGNGTVGALTIVSGGTLAPGNSPGIINSGTFSLNNGSTLAMEITGNTASPVAGTHYDQVNVVGNVTLGGALSLDLTSFTPVFGSIYFLVNNDASDLVSGVFSNANFAPSTAFTLFGQDWQINYNANFSSTTAANFTSALGNDVALLAIPEPSALLLLTGSLAAALTFRRRRRE